MHICSDLLQTLHVSQLNVTITKKEVNEVIHKLKMKHQCKTDGELMAQLGLSNALELYEVIQRNMENSITHLVKLSMKEQLFEQLIELFHDNKERSNKAIVLENAITHFLQQYPIELDRLRVQEELEKTAHTSDTMIAAKTAVTDIESYQKICAKVMEKQILEKLMAHASVTQQELSFTQLHNKNINQIPIITINTENKCGYCSAKHCCNYITQKIPEPETQKDFDHLLWQVSHHNISVFEDATGWYLMIETPCEHLTHQGKCNIYQHRPQVCRDYKNTFCEFDYANDTSHFIHFFVDYDSFLAYYNNVAHKKAALR
ncbi:YkgJ family cysteine cluster protein [Vibrio sp. Of7-15]|uniref:YkgJ family cysteine cluster protein n=1 Tax=Vibrio sp. Of7-15 TaxID=2724879 RepID=UPI001EF32B5E|nr:YkgJ family cysteine cluster protein [Vibrio sp. Of7-15]MCG7497995.1 YkgJ family cysteine cluster protein [Vibrio sp. Of7-15]